MLSGPPPSLAASIRASQMSSSGNVRVAENLGDLLVRRRPRRARPSRAGSDRPAPGCTSVTSTSGSSPPDSARVTTLRHGCWRAAARRHRPGAHLLLDPRVIVRELVELSVAQHGRRGCRRRARRRRDAAPARSADAVVAMPRRSLRVGDRGGDPAVREAERGLQPVGFEADAGFERERPGAVLVGAGRVVDERLDGVDGHRATRPRRRRGRPCRRRRRRGRCRVASQ